MSTSDWSRRQGHRLLQLGILLFFLALLVGLFVPRFAVPRLGVSTHLLGIMQGTFLMIIGVLWPRLRIPRVSASVGVFLALYGCFAAWMANLTAAIWGAGNTMLPLAAGTARGSAGQEMAITIALRSAAVSLIAVALLVSWGLRTLPRNQGETME